ncbi:hypothetical protein RhiirA4_475882 [Rhizophagus irregularis]|uniref:SHSP domain-containing protein n=1 Tax=Rhizophagus irregularis TaxID=588596 RepID=A0A2I1HAR8_9GLOM|nr:hypothetical protein RhiirA4_475882 [Rhizophagus irregularis]
MSLYQSNVNHIFDDFIKDLNVARRGSTRSGRSGRGNNTYFAPLIDVHENDKEFLVNAELPGLNKDQINIDNGLLELKLPKSAPTGKKITIE